MDDDDKGFFILVLGVLAAILMVVSWWFIRNTDELLQPAVDTPEIAADHDDNDDDDHGDHAMDDGDHDDGDDHAMDDDDHGDDGHEHDEDGNHIEDTTDTEASGDADDSDAPADGAAAAGVTLGALLAGDPEWSETADLMDDAGLLDVLEAQEGPFTVLAPSNDAINGLDPAAAALLLDRNGESTMQYHVIDGSYTFDDLTALVGRGARSGELTTVHGDPISVSVEDDLVLIDGAAAFSGRSEQASNGMIHTIDSVLVPRETALNLVVNLEPIQFASGSADIDAESQATLDQVAEMLAATDINVTVEGHTDDQGDPILNQNLSQSRARSVVNYLVAAGIDAGRLDAVGFGPSQPIADNETEQGRAQNRRIEFKVTN